MAMELLRETAAQWGTPLSSHQLDLFERYYRAIVDWNERLNLTRITEYRLVQTRHFLDSLALLRAMGDASALRARLVDVGAGAGLPGLALKIALPELQVTLVESAEKKAAFLRHVVRLLGLSEVEVVADRAETAARDSRHRETYGYAVARALAPLPTALELTLPFVMLGGKALLPRKGDLAAEIASAGVALEALSGRHVATLAVDLPGEEHGRGIVVVEKAVLTDERYPRRPGMPTKRPLG